MTVDRYLAEVPGKRRPCLERLRALCRETLVGYEERFEYGMPGYARPDGGIEVAFASQARHITLYIMRKDVLDRFRERLGNASLGKGCVRFSSPAAIDLELVREMLVASTRADDGIC